MQDSGGRRAGGDRGTIPSQQKECHHFELQRREEEVISTPTHSLLSSILTLTHCSESIQASANPSPQKSPQRISNGEEDESKHNDPLDEDDDEEEEDKNIDLDVSQSRGYKNILIIHEPQVDFFGSSNGEIGERVAEFIENNLDNIDEIYVTLDSHYVSTLLRCVTIFLFMSHFSLLTSQKIHMSSRGFWSNSFNSQPEIGTAISSQDIAQETWLPRKRELTGYCLEVLQTQSAVNKTHDCVVIGAEHCSVSEWTSLQSVVMFGKDSLTYLLILLLTDRLSRLGHRAAHQPGSQRVGRLLAPQCGLSEQRHECGEGHEHILFLDE
jgi:hypothetical protein